MSSKKKKKSEPEPTSEPIEHNYDLLIEGESLELDELEQLGRETDTLVTGFYKFKEDFKKVPPLTEKQIDSIIGEVMDLEEKVEEVAEQVEAHVATVIETMDMLNDEVPSLCMDVPALQKRLDALYAKVFPVKKHKRKAA